MPNLWIQGMTEAGEDRAIRKRVARHMRDVHDHVAAALRARQETGIVPADRTRTPRPGCSSAAGCSAPSRDRLGGLLDEADLAAIQRERIRWLTGGRPSQAVHARGPEGEHPERRSTRPEVAVRQAASAATTRRATPDLALAEPSLQ